MISFIKYYKLWESSQDTIDIPYIIGDQYTSGVHAFREDEKEIPAKDPASIIKPTIIYDGNSLEQLLSQYGSEVLNVVYLRHEWGSYHERQLYCQAHLQLFDPNDFDDREALIDELENIKIEDDYYHPLEDSFYSSRNVVKKITQFSSFDEVLENWWEMVRTSDIKTPVGSSEDYWKRKILATKMQHRKEYDGD
jgi:hypothetical protein